MGATGRRSAGPGPAEVSGVVGEDITRPHAHLTLAITPQPTANHYEHVQGGFVRSEPVSTQPRNEEDLQSGFTRRKRSDQPPADQEAAATTSEDQDAVEGDQEAASSGASVPGATRSAGGSAADDSDMFLEPEDAGAGGAPPAADHETQAEPAGQPQNLFPAFQPLFPLGHSRPPIFQEPAYSQRQALLRPQYNAFHPLEIASTGPGVHGGTGPTGPGTFRERAYPQAAPAELHSNALLGSGNFGVIHGGTFYGEDKEDEYETHSSLSHSFYGGNGHGRPAFYRGNPEPQRYRTSEDFFANFRDFADISAPTKSSFSEFYVVYVNRNATKDDAGTVVAPGSESAGTDRVQAHARPNNIMERLAQLDREHSANEHQEQEKPRKKLSLGKRKLALIKKSKKPQSPRDAHEPLLALS